MKIQFTGLPGQSARCVLDGPERRKTSRAMANTITKEIHRAERTRIAGFYQWLEQLDCQNAMRSNAYHPRHLPSNRRGVHATDVAMALLDDTPAILISVLSVA